MKRTPLRRSRLRKPSQSERASAWRDAVMRASEGRCVVTGEPAEEAHHAISRQTLRRHGFGPAVIWDARNGIALTTRVHARHTAAVEPVPSSCLPAKVHEFAAELGLGWYLARHYPADCEGGTP